MQFETIAPDESIALFVKNIMVFEDASSSHKTTLPFFADGYPGLMFQDTQNGLFVSPHQKQMPRLFLYGQTVKPIELLIDGSYKLIVFQLYPYVLKSLFDVVAQDITDGCYDLEQFGNGRLQLGLLTKNEGIEARIEIISSFLEEVFEAKRETLDSSICIAIQHIIARKGLLPIGKLCDELHMTERTLERRFLRVVGISAKQFSRIIQFQQSLEQLSLNEHASLADIVYAHGYTDQSHFIRVFKAFTGKTPKKFAARRLE